MRITPIAVFTRIHKDLNKLVGFARCCHFLTQNALAFNHHSGVTDAVPTDNGHSKFALVIDVGCKSCYGLRICL